MRTLVERAFASYGASVRIDGADVHLREGWVFHLDNLARGVAQETGPESRAEHVDAFVRAMLETVAAKEPAGGLTDHEIADRLQIRLLPQENLAETEPAGVESRPFLEGVIQVLVVDLPDQVHFVDAELLECLGGWDAAYARAHANLRALRLGGTVQRLGSATSGAVLDVIVDDSFYTASKALIAREFVETVIGGPIGQGGFYFTIPNRHQFAFCLVQDSTALTSLPPMAHFAHGGWAESPGPISPLVYWHDGQRAHDIAMVDPSALDGNALQGLDQMQLNLPGALEDVLSGLGAR